MTTHFSLSLATTSTSVVSVDGRLAVAARVLEEVGDHARQLHLVGQHVEVFGHVHGDLQLAVVLHGIDAGGDHGVQVHGAEHDAMIGAGVVQELVDGGVELHDVGHHMLARHIVIDAHLGLQAQARQRRAQVVGDAGQHHGAVLLQLGQLLRHAVEADVDLADFAGHGLLVELAGVEVALAHAVGRIDSCLSGRLIRRAMAAAPMSESRAAVISQISQVWPLAG
jgi:hypothetical protein